MKKTFTYLRTLLVGLMAVTATGTAWGIEVTETYDFGAFITANGAPGMSLGSVVATQSGTSEYTGGDLYLLNNPTGNGNTLELNGRFALDYGSKAAYKIRFMWRSSGNAYQHGLAGNWNNNGASVTACHLSILNLKEGDKVTMTWAVKSGSAAQPYLCNSGVVTDVDADAYLENNKEYTIATDGNLDLYFKNNNFAISKIVIVTEGTETVSTPSVKITGAYNEQRYVTITSGKSTIDSEVTTYYTTDGSTPTSSSNVYSEPILVDGGATVNAISISAAGTSSEVASITADSEGTLALNTPSLAVKGIEKNGETYSIKFGAEINNASILGAPEATLSAEFNGSDVTSDILAGTFTPSELGTLVIKAEADGYNSSEISKQLAASYIQTWQSADFSSLTDLEAVQSALGSNWAVSASTGRWASWTTANEPYTFFEYPADGVVNVTVNEKVFFRNVVVLAKGMGLGRNQGENIYITNTKAGEIVQFEIYSGFGNEINKGVNTYLNYAISDGINRPVMSSKNSDLLVQATLFTPASTSTEITSAGWATYIAPYALDFSGVDGLTAYTATCDGATVTLTKVEDVPAGTGVVLQGAQGTYNIPVIASSETTKGDLKGSVSEDTTADGTQYILTKTGSNAQFAPATAASTIAAGKAYLVVAGGESRLNVVIAGETTGIKAIEAQEAQEGIYNLQGQRVAKAQKGLYIVNGKKAIVK